MSWRVDTQVQPDGTVHVWPVDDVILHDLNGTDCVCGPQLEAGADGSWMVSHASLDGRELTE